ncbi:MAG: prepilin-type N-terminal cleavage/methylation domain-containing protein [Chloroflexi bacterium]|nr:prepilin-type N-terminal cleavage/methylation domain-containing protein [Chloroflexota bacterium]
MVRNERGISLVENLISLALVAVIVTAYLTLLDTGFKSADLSGARVTAQDLVRVELEYIRAQSYFEPPTSTYLIPPGGEPGAYAVPPPGITLPSGFDITVVITQYCDGATCYPIDEIQQVRTSVSRGGRPLASVADLKTNR